MGSSRHRRKKAPRTNTVEWTHLSVARRKELIVQEAIKGYSVAVIADHLGCTQPVVYAVLEDAEVQEKLDIEKQIREAEFQKAVDKHNYETANRWMEMHKMVDDLLYQEMKKLIDNHGDFLVTEEKVEQEASYFTKTQLKEYAFKFGLGQDDETLKRIATELLPVSKISKTKRKPDAKYIASLWNTISKHFFSMHKQGGPVNETG